MEPLRVLDIVAGTSVDGPGLRTSIYFAGCRHACPGCHNPESWDMAGGRPMTVEEIMDVVRDNDFNVTFSGGDPFYQPLESLAALAAAIKADGYTLWAYTGYLLEDLQYIPGASEVLNHMDTLVDGPFVLALRDTGLRFRGSSNQRIIPLHTPSTPQNQ